jgi:adenine-specific DNA-methyltransferase
VVDAISAYLKEGKSEVVCDQDHLWKVSKDKNGVVTRDKLTKHWTDWVDYWPVDFDYESRPEIIHEPRSVKTGEPLPGWQPGDELVAFVRIQ